MTTVGSDAPSRAPFTSRRGRTMALVLGVVALALFGVLGYFLRGRHLNGEWTLADRGLMAGIGVGLAAALWRWASIRAVPGDTGLTVRNLAGSRHIPWADITEVTFDEGEAWASIHLVDTEQVAVMAIQRADGPSSRDEARRLAQLVAHSRRT
ncbi:PH (Pleckstrin Homology) domain-containing protein [Knoellia remsis]|uniref:PH (Pleckstrin Homology) domain-containing protein n=1 Tax=Knoellia remsis TaxID=407159 RepID=A0A2T0UUA1_9MICO|nr:PH domain-containing protein [Knoellia remsis]PRY61501.1 PH (Pleckstrin Homology) domain-containing protein [Knoellia remsis]